MISNDDSTPLAEHDKTSLQYLPVMCDAVVKVNFLFVPPVNRPRYLDNGFFFCKTCPRQEKKVQFRNCAEKSKCRFKNQKKQQQKNTSGLNPNDHR